MSLRQERASITTKNKMSLFVKKVMEDVTFQYKIFHKSPDKQRCLTKLGECCGTVGVAAI
jgi:hypothetical protein